MEKIDDTKLISLGAFIVATIVLLVIAWRDASQLGEIYWIYCLAFAGLKVSKGIVSTMQKRDELSKFKEQVNERNVDSSNTNSVMYGHYHAQSEAEKNRPTTGRSNS